MIKINYQGTNQFLPELLKQYYKEIDLSKEAEIQILENENQFIISKKDLNQKEILKPVLMEEVINIIDNLILENNLDNVIKIGSVNFFLNQKLCLVEDKEISLTAKECELLEFLYKHPEGKTKTEILAKVWGYSEDIQTNTLESHIYKLRSKFPSSEEIISLKNDKYIIEKHS